jgi:hypothetical protein
MNLFFISCLKDNISQFKSLNDLALELNNTSLKSFEINFPDEVTIKNKEIAQDKQSKLTIFFLN